MKWHTFYIHQESARAGAEPSAPCCFIGPDVKKTLASHVRQVPSDNKPIIRQTADEHVLQSQQKCGLGNGIG